MRHARAREAGGADRKGGRLQPVEQLTVRVEQLAPSDHVDRIAFGASGAEVASSAGAAGAVVGVRACSAATAAVREAQTPSVHVAGRVRKA